TANSSFPFLGWSGDASGSTNPLVITADGQQNITATSDAYTVTTAANPFGLGTVTKSPNQTFYSAGQVVSLQATAATGYQFASWSGDASGTSNPTEITINGNKNVLANFALTPPICGGWSLIPTGAKPSARSQAAAIWDPVR